MSIATKVVGLVGAVFGIFQRSGGGMLVRQPGGVAGTDDIEVYHDGTNGIVQSKSGKLRLVTPGSSSDPVEVSATLLVGEFNDSYYGVRTTSTGKFLFSTNGNPQSGSYGLGFEQVAAGVAKASDGASGYGWLQHAGQSRVATAVTNDTTTPAVITGLSASVKAGRKYTGKLVLYASNTTAADGLLLDFDGGTATMTSFQAGITANVQGATLGTTVSAALATDITATALNGTGVNVIEVEFAFVCNAAGTFIPRIAMNADTGGTITIDANSFMELQDCP